MVLEAVMHAWGEGSSFRVRLGEFPTEEEAREAALRFRKRFADSVDAVILYKDEEDVYGKEERAHGGSMGAENGAPAGVRQGNRSRELR